MARKLKQSIYYKQLKHEIQDVELVYNKLVSLTYNEDIPADIIEKDYQKCICQLELSLAALCIMIRKMVENQFITISQELRKDVNSIIHSNRFELEDGDKLAVYSQKGKEAVSIKQLLEYAKQL